MRLYALLIITICSSPGFSQVDKDYIDEIQKIKEIYIDSCLASTPILTTQIDGRTEYWRDMKVKDKIHMISIESQNSKSDYSEIYLIRNNKLVYAYESIIDYSKRPDDYSPWNCQYWIKNDIIIDYVSLGHGATEFDEWEPEEILVQFNDRISIFNIDKR